MGALIANTSMIGIDAGRDTMNKNTTKKIRLGTQTIRQLTQQENARVNGGDAFGVCSTVTVSNGCTGSCTCTTPTNVAC